MKMLVLAIKFCTSVLYLLLISDEESTSLISAGCFKDYLTETMTEKQKFLFIVPGKLAVMRVDTDLRDSGWTSKKKKVS